MTLGQPWGDPIPHERQLGLLLGHFSGVFLWHWKSVSFDAAHGQRLGEQAIGSRSTNGKAVDRGTHW